MSTLVIQDKRQNRRFPFYLSLTKPQTNVS